MSGELLIYGVWRNYSATQQSQLLTYKLSIFQNPERLLAGHPGSKSRSKSTSPRSQSHNPDCSIYSPRRLPPRQKRYRTKSTKSDPIPCPNRRRITNRKSLLLLLAVLVYAGRSTTCTLPLQCIRRNCCRAWRSRLTRPVRKHSQIIFR